ncbi:hypothetical protein BACCOP_00311 [Phocaeicola coprocola DSM 17136]|uniref:Uncharacterized protein n=1 Tax=Phocaeicola coprocola DSM 17136 TaxID=470145 RepID=B3JEL8_9BACT|nr:hypothetical protein BACCOP_02281 [Phocaeicola coprocola DSM 17136]EDV02593.1 hypothetical protein BACCOP_00311 [Phocaeicola coprocola DSM 17136]
MKEPCLQPYPDNSGTTLKNKKQNYIKRLTIYTKVQEPINRLHIPEHTRSLSGSLLGYKTIP